jgi:predicted PurR-regulated permease PerM
MPVLFAAVLGAVAGPAVGWLERHRIPRIGGAILILLGLVAIGLLIFCLVFGGITAQSDDISTELNGALDKIRAGSRTPASTTRSARKRTCKARCPRSAGRC